MFAKFLFFLDGLRMETPKSYGWFHLLWVGMSLALIAFFAIRRKKFGSEKSLKAVLLIYGIIAFVLELLKQIVWSCHFDEAGAITGWSYQWYAAPFQLCSIPIYVSLLAACLPRCKLRNALFAFLAFFSILGSIATFVYPAAVFTDQILINVHTMWLHCGSLVVSVYLMLTGAKYIKIGNYLQGGLVFLVVAGIAELLNVTFHLSGLTEGATFNMFYISPFFRSELPVYNMIWESTPFPVFLLLYFVGIALGSLAVFGVAKLLLRITRDKR